MPRRASRQNATAIVRSGSLLLKKSFCTRDQNFFWLYTRLSRKRCGRPHFLKSDFFKQENWRRAIWDFFNSIGQKLKLPHCDSNDWFTSMSRH
jgi:hypothetical protein